MNLTTEHLNALRTYLKEFSATSLDAEHQEQADIVNGLIPALVDSISDEELTEMMNSMWSFTLNTIINQTNQEEPTDSNNFTNEGAPISQPKESE